MRWIRFKYGILVFPDTSYIGPWVVSCAEDRHETLEIPDCFVRMVSDMSLTKITLHPSSMDDVVEVWIASSLKRYGRVKIKAVEPSS